MKKFQKKLRKSFYANGKRFETMDEVVAYGLENNWVVTASCKIQGRTLIEFRSLESIAREMNNPF